MNMWKVITNVRINPPLFKKPPVRPPGKNTIEIVAKQGIIRCIARNILSQNHPRIDLEGHTRK
ncbi:hypothetical protein YC2023_066620 [Brassica napus]